VKGRGDVVGDINAYRRICHGPLTCVKAGVVVPRCVELQEAQIQRGAPSKRARKDDSVYLATHLVVDVTREMNRSESVYTAEARCN
jgi:hypothetical protein